MEANKDLILYLPFDNPDEYGVAFDYSKSRADSILSGGAFLTKDAKIGKALNLNGTGECTTPIELDFLSEWTLSMYLKTENSKIGWLLNFDGIENYYDKWVDVEPNQWVFFVFVKTAESFVVYKNGITVDVYDIIETPIGFSINDFLLGGHSAIIDEVKLYSSVVSHSDILKEQYKSMDVEYYLDGKNLKDYFVEVSDSTGVMGIPERKEALSIDWSSYHGLVTDKKRPRYKERVITLECFIEARSKSEFVVRVMDFVSLFTKEDTRRLRIDYSGNTLPFVYEVECINQSDIAKKWRYDDGLMVGTFSLRLVEYEPVKRVLRHIGLAGSTASITVSSNKLLNIYWGDGTYTYNISGNNKVVTHTYIQDGEFDIVITGVIEDITYFDSNCIVLWQKLM